MNALPEWRTIEIPCPEPVIVERLKLNCDAIVEVAGDKNRWASLVVGFHFQPGSEDYKAEAIAKLIERTEAALVVLKAMRT